MSDKKDKKGECQREKNNRKLKRRDEKEREELLMEYKMPKMISTSGFRIKKRGEEANRRNINSLAKWHLMASRINITSRIEPTEGEEEQK